jgi:chromosome segregation ATPase
MTRSQKVLGFVMVTMLGAYGCAKGPAGGDGRTAAAEAKAKRLEEDFRAAAAARDSFRQRLIAAEEKQAQLQKQLDETTTTATQDRKDRDAARTELRARTAERDQLQVQ